MKVERVSYDVITPSAARSMFEAILWKPGIRWRVSRIDVLAPVRWISVRRNEVGAVASSVKAVTAMREGVGALALYVEDERQQRAGLLLRDVAYRLYAQMELVCDEARGNPAKYHEMFTRRARAGQCVNQPYLGCREFAARFRLIELQEEARLPDGERPALQAMSADLGWMLHDLDYSDAAAPRPRFFRARVEAGVMDLERVEVRG